MSCLFEDHDVSYEAPPLLSIDLWNPYTNEPYKHVESQQDGTKYFIARHQRKFQVRCTVKNVPTKPWLLKCFVDGVDIHDIDTNVDADGFVWFRVFRDSKDHFSTYPMKFKSINTSSHTVEDTSPAVSSIKCVMYESLGSALKENNADLKNSDDRSGTGVCTLNSTNHDAKKFYEWPALSVTLGNLVKEKPCRTRIFTRGSQLAQCCVGYDTAERLALRGCLAQDHPSFPKRLRDVSTRKLNKKDVELLNTLLSRARVQGLLVPHPVASRACLDIETCDLTADDGGECWTSKKRIKVEGKVEEDTN